MKVFILVLLFISSVSFNKHVKLILSFVLVFITNLPRYYKKLSALHMPLKLFRLKFLFSVNISQYSMPPQVTFCPKSLNLVEITLFTKEGRS